MERHVLKQFRSRREEKACNQNIEKVVDGKEMLVWAGSFRDFRPIVVVNLAMQINPLEGTGP